LVLSRKPEKRQGEMRKALIIAGREIHSSVVTPFFFVLVSIFSLLSGFFFFTLLQQFTFMGKKAAVMQNISPSLNEFVVVPFYQSLLFLLLCLLPLLAMRAFPRERALETYELLMTAPLTPADLVLGKFLGLLSLTVIVLAVAFLYPGLLMVLADPEVVPALVGGGGLVLFSAALLSLSLAVSAFSRSQTTAALVSFALLVALFVIDVPAAKVGGEFARVLFYLAPVQHVQNAFRGVIDGGDILYLLSLCGVGIFVANRALEGERCR
jgi:ABC-2 type transport system permease protein